MKKTILLFAAVMMAAVTFAQAQPTVSASSVTFKYCETTYGVEHVLIAGADLTNNGYQWKGTTYYKPGSYIKQETNVRGCDSLITLELEAFHAFSVSKTLKVMIAKSNLQYQASTKTWRFADKPWTIIGNTEQNKCPQQTSDEWIDIFPWGSNGKVEKTDPCACACNGQTQNNQFEYSTFNDWGQNNIGNDPANYWRTLSKDEWTYLLSTRKVGGQNGYHAATVNNISGLIVIPDDWDWTGFSWANSYTESGWNALSDKGAIFLPFAGKRHSYVSGSWKTDFETTGGGYWSSSKGGMAARCSYFNITSFINNGPDYMFADPDIRDYCYSVRLVHNSAQ